MGLLIPAVVEGEFPAMFTFVVTNDVARAIVSTEFEISMIGRKPTIEDFRYPHCVQPEMDSPRLLLASVSRVAIDVNCYGLGRFFRHAAFP